MLTKFDLVQENQPCLGGIKVDELYRNLIIGSKTLNMWIQICDTYSYTQEKWKIIGGEAINLINPLLGTRLEIK